MNAFRSVGAWIALAGIATTIVGAWVAIWAVLSSNWEGMIPLAVGLLLTLSGAAMLFVAWAYDREKAKEALQAAADARKVRAIYDEELVKLREQVRRGDLLAGGGFEEEGWNVSEFD